MSARSKTSPEPSPSPEQFRTYQIQSKLDYFDTHPTYRAIHLPSGDPVALTVLPRMSSADSERMQQRFYARRPLEHGNIARLREEGIRESSPWYATELHEGLPLSFYLVPQHPSPSQSAGDAQDTRDTLVSINAPAPSVRPSSQVRVQRGLRGDQVQRILTLGRQICDALSAMHQRGFYHGNLSTRTILLRAIDDEPVLLDPGLWEPARGSESGVEWPPELLAGEQPSSRSDVYAVGVILYELFSGLPFADVQDNGAPAPLSSLVDLPKLLYWQIHQMLALDPQKRPQSPADCVMALAPFLEQERSTHPRFSPTLDRTAGRSAHAELVKQKLFEEGSRGVFLETEPGVDLTVFLGTIAAHASARGWKVSQASECPWPLPFGAFENILWALEDPVYPDAHIDSWDDPAVPIAIARGAFLDQAERFLENHQELFIIHHTEHLDDFSRALLLRLLKAGPPRRFLLTSSRPWALPIEPLPRVLIPKLSESDIDVLVKNVLGTPRPPPGLQRALAERQQEEPWLIEQQLGSLVDRGHLFRDDIGVWRRSGDHRNEFDASLLRPSKLLIQERRESLPPLARRLLAAVALLKTSVPTSWAFILLGLPPDDPECMEALDYLLRGRWLLRLPSGLIGLSTSTLRDTAEDLDRETIQCLHENAIDMFQVSTRHWHLGRLAYHHEQAGNLEHSADLHEEIGNQAWRMGAVAQAKACWEKAYKLIPKGSLLQKGRLQRRIALALAAQGEPAQAHRNLNLALQDLSAKNTVLPKALRAWETAAQATPDTQREQALAYTQIALLPIQASAERIRAAWNALQLGEGLSPVPSSLALAYSVFEELLERLPLATRSLPVMSPSWRKFRQLTTPPQEALRWVRQGLQYIHLARWSQAEQALHRASSRARHLKAWSVWLQASVYLGLALFLQGEFLQCEEIASQLAEQVPDETDAPWFARLLRAEMALQRGNSAEVLELLPESPACSKRLAARSRGLRALALVREGQPDQARKLASLALVEHPSLLEAEAMFCAIQALSEAPPNPANGKIQYTLLCSLRLMADEAPVLVPRLQLAELTLGHKRHRIEAILHEARRMELLYVTASALRGVGYARRDLEAEDALGEAEALLRRLRG